MTQPIGAGRLSRLRAATRLQSWRGSWRPSKLWTVGCRMRRRRSN